MRLVMRLLLPALTLLMALHGASAHADEFQLPGLAADADAYLSSLTAKFPAGAGPAARLKSEQQAADAMKRRDWAAVAQAWETRIGQGDAKPELWLLLAEAQLRRIPPDAARALQAAWENFNDVDG